MMELASTYAKILVEQLLNVHALASMYRSSGNIEYYKTAAGWLPSLERTFQSLKTEFETTLSPTTEDSS